MISDALYESVVEACPTQLSILPDCMVLTSLPECGVVAPNFNSDRLRLSSMSPGDCAVYNATHWAYMVNASSDRNYDCCTALNSWKDPIGDVCIYDIMGRQLALRAITAAVFPLLQAHFPGGTVFQLQYSLLNCNDCRRR